MRGRAPITAGKNARSSSETGLERADEGWAIKAIVSD